MTILTWLTFITILAISAAIGVVWALAWIWWTDRQSDKRYRRRWPNG
jgi:ABC-type transporter Mla subunit MlaD